MDSTTSEQPAYEVARELIEIAARRLALTVEWEFVPFSKSRNAKEKMASLNWQYVLLRAGREIMRGDYMQGCAHAPAYKAPVSKLGNQNSIMRDGAIRSECETGRVWVGTFAGTTGTLPKPSITDLLGSVVRDADAIDYPTYEEWASNLGYDEDSRKGEAIYRACLEIGLKLRAALGDAELQKLRDLAGQL